MKRLEALFITAVMAAAPCMMGAERYVGGDISLLPEYENAGAKYLTHDGKPIADLLPWLHQQGMNAQRIRLFVNPKQYKEQHSQADDKYKYDPNACQDLEYILPLCQDIVNNGMDLMLDFHYSDTWADPAAQWTPADWEGLTDEQLYQKIYDYTRETLLTLRDAGVVPAFIQPGNEISYGMLWGPVGTSNPKKTLMGSDANWERLGKLLGQAIRACREVCPEAKIVIHTERTPDVVVLKNFYNRMSELNIDYDIIGLSYYPYFHGKMSVLESALGMLQLNFPDKNIMIVETGYSYKWEVPGSTHDNTGVWPLSDAGQNQFAKDLVATLERYDHVNGLFWWWMEYNAYSTNLSGWYNAPLFDSINGRACSALKTICSFAGDSGVGNIFTDAATPMPWHDINGRRYDGMPRVPGIYIHDGKKIIVK